MIETLGIIHGIIFYFIYRFFYRVIKFFLLTHTRLPIGVICIIAFFVVCVIMHWHGKAKRRY